VSVAQVEDKEAMTERILEGIENGLTLAELCRTEGIARRTFYNWLDADEELGSRFARARAIGFDAIAEEALEIADTPEVGEIVTEKPLMVDGKQLGNAVIREIKTDDMLGHRKLKVDTRLKLLAKWDPKRYGERTTIAGDPDAPLAPAADVSAQATLLATILDAARQRRDNDGSDLA
jgi:transposase-like protein